MLKPKETVFDRIEQTFVLFKNNFNGILLPILLYRLVAVCLLLPIVSFFYFSINPINFPSMEGVEWADVFSSLSWVAPFYGYYAVYMTLGMFYFIIYIGFFLWLVKSIKQAFDWDKITSKDNVLYGFNNILNSFKTYWYLFAYVYLIPALIFIVGGIIGIVSLVSNWWFSKDIDALGWIAISLISISILVFAVFAVYRWIRATFPIVSAVDKDTYDKDNFDFSLSVADDNWGRIFWNIILVSIIIWMVSWVISMIPNTIWAMWTNISSYYSTDSGFEQIKQSLESLGDFNIFRTISQFLSVIISTVGSVFVTVFIYIFFKRLELEKSNRDGNEDVEDKSNDSNVEGNDVSEEKEKSDY